MSALALALAPSASAASPARAVAAARLRAVLHAPNHTPTAGRKWWITIRVTKGRINPGGSVNYEFVYNGSVVGHARGHGFRHGRFRDDLLFPAESVGFPLTLRIVVKTSYGTVYLNWAVRTRR